MSSKLGVQNIAHTNGTNAMTIDSDGATTFTSDPFNSVIETWYYHTGAIAESSGAVLDATWYRQTDNGTANKNVGMSASSGIWTFPSTGIWQVTLLYQFYVSASSSNKGVTLRHTPNNGSNHNNIISMYSNVYASSAHGNITLPWTFNITNTSNQKISYTVAGDNTTVAGGSGVHSTKIQFIKLCPSV